MLLYYIINQLLPGAYIGSLRFRYCSSSWSSYHTALDSRASGMYFISCELLQNGGSFPPKASSQRRGNLQRDQSSNGRHIERRRGWEENPSSSGNTTQNLSYSLLLFTCGKALPVMADRISSKNSSKQSLFPLLASSPNLPQSLYKF